MDGTDGKAWDIAWLFDPPEVSTNVRPTASQTPATRGPGGGAVSVGPSEAPRAKRRVWALFEKSDKLIEIDPNGFGLDAVLFWASGTQ